MHKPDSSENHATPTSLPVSMAESWNYKQGSGHAPTEGVSPPTSTGLEGEQLPSSKEEYHLQDALEHLKLAGDGPKKPETVDGDKRRGHQPSLQVVNELHARIQHLEAELEVSRRLPDRRDVHLEGVPPPPYQSSLPNYYGSSPHSGEIVRGSNFSGPLPPHQYPQTQTTSLPVEAGYYSPCEFYLINLIN